MPGYLPSSGFFPDIGGGATGAYLPLSGGTLTGALTISSGGINVTGTSVVTGSFTVSGGSSTLTVANSNTLNTFTTTNVGTGTSGGTTFQNTTPAGAGAQQYSPIIRLIGRGWKTNATAESQPVEFAQQVIPIQGTSAPTGEWHLLRQINSGGYSTVLKVDSTGVITTTSHLVVAANQVLAFGSTSGAQMFVSGETVGLSCGTNQTVQISGGRASGNANEDVVLRSGSTRNATDVVCRWKNNSTTIADIMGGVSADGETVLKLAVHDGGAAVVKMVKADTGAGGKRMLYVDD